MRAEYEKEDLGYLDWLETHGWRVTFSRQMSARISVMYTTWIMR